MFQKLGFFMRLIMQGGDSRTFLLPLANPWVPLFTFFLFLLFVSVIGPKFMRNRKPYELKHIIVIYNIFQVLLSIHLFVLFSQHGWCKISSWFKCKPIDESLSSEFQHLLNGHHLYYISKYTELLDTLFFVLRKKEKQITFLHVYHHGTMPFFTCLTLRFSPGSSVSFIGFLNSFVHIIMYGYYMLAGLGPKIQKYLWWKRYITSLQLAQFITLFIHFSIVLGSSCNVPKGMALFVTGNIAFNFALFYHFYRKEYKQKMKVRLESKTCKSILKEANGDLCGASELNGILQSNGTSHSNGINGNAIKLSVHSNSVSDNLRQRAYS